MIRLVEEATRGLTHIRGTVTGSKGKQAIIELPQGEGPSPVMLGESNDEALLGAVTLEILGLVLNPFNRTLQPMRAMPA